MRNHEIYVDWADERAAWCRTQTFEFTSRVEAQSAFDSIVQRFPGAIVHRFESGPNAVESHDGSALDGDTFGVSPSALREILVRDLHAQGRPRRHSNLETIRRLLEVA